MLVRNWMTQDVLTVTPDMQVIKASNLMKKHGIRRLPVVDGSGVLIGIVSDRNIKEAMPSKATTLDMHELSYLLSQLKLQDVMTRKPITVRDDDLIETAAIIMEERKIGGLPVVNKDGELCGILTESDVFKCMLRFTGAHIGGLLLAFEKSDKPGTLRPIMEVLYRHGASIISVLTTHENENGLRRLYIRVRPMPQDREAALIEEFKTGSELVFWRSNTD